MAIIAQSGRSPTLLFLLTAALLLFPPRAASGQTDDRSEMLAKLPPPPQEIVVERSAVADKAAPDSAFIDFDWRDWVSQDPGPYGMDLEKSNSVWTRETNDHTPVAAGKILVVHIFVDDPTHSWSSVSAFHYNKTEMMSKAGDACDWIVDKAPASAAMEFSNKASGIYRTHYYYTTSVTSNIPNESSDGTAWIEDAVANLGYTDSDGDLKAIDEMLDAMQVFYPGYDWALALFHPDKEGRSYASKSVSRAVVFPRNKADGFNTFEGVFSHEMLHLFGATDEYPKDDDDTTCPRYHCDENVEHPWLEWWYMNENCVACNEDNARCIMEISSPILPVDICSHTEGHIGWKDGDDDGDRDLKEVYPHTWWTAGPEPTVAETFYNVNARAWTPNGDISAMQYQVNATVDSGAWINASPYDGTWDEPREMASFSVDLPDEGNNVVWVRAKNSYGNWQKSVTQPSFTIYRDTTGPTAPTMYATPNSNQDKWWNSTAITVTWYGASDHSGIDGYSYLIDKWPTSPVDETNMGTARSTSFTADMTANYYAHVAAVDGLGNWGTQRDFRIRVDLTAPQAPVISSTTHTEATWSNKTTGSFSYTATDTGSGVWGYRVVLDSTADTQVSSSGSTGSSTSLTMYEGIRYVHVAARDHAGNWGPTSHFEVWTHMTPPAAPAVSHSSPAMGSKWYASDAATFAWEEPVTPPGIEGYSYELAAGKIAANPDEVLDPDTGSHEETGLTSGHHTFSVRAKDNAGNWGARGLVTIGIDVDGPPAVTNLQSPSHALAMGVLHPVQSADSTVDIFFNNTIDPHSGTAEYAVLWDQNPTSVPGPANATSIGTVTTYTSPELDTGSWYVHVRAVDEVGNWSATADVAHLGPIVIDTTPPGAPWALVTDSGNAEVALTWRAPTDPDIDHYIVYRSTDEDLLGSAVATDWPDTFLTDTGLTNGETYYYRMVAIDVVNLVSDPSYQIAGEPEYTSPGDGTAFADLAELRDASSGAVRDDGGGGFTMHGNVTISQMDTLHVGAGQMLRSTDRSGLKQLIIQGTLRAIGDPGDRAVFGATNAQPGSWGGLHMDVPGGNCRLEQVTVQHAVTNVLWHGSNPVVLDSEISRAAGNGLDINPHPGGTAIVQGNTINSNGLYGLTVFGPSSSATDVVSNTVTGNQHGIFWNTVFGGDPPTILNIDGNTVQSNSMDGIRCGYGGATTVIQNNLVHNNNRGIVFEFEGTSPTAPQILTNEITSNDFAGVYVGDMAHPDVTGNRIVGNRSNGVYCANEGFPTLRDNVIAGSNIGVNVTNTSLVPDMGTTGSPGHNRLDAHTTWYVQNIASITLNAQLNYWGTAQPNPAPVVLGGVNFMPTWNVLNSAPSIAVIEPSGAVTTSTTADITWTDMDPDPTDTLTVSLFYTDTPGGTTYTGIAGAAAIDGWDPGDVFTWDVTGVDPGTYYVYATISDGNLMDSATSTGTVEVVLPQLTVDVDSLFAGLNKNEITSLAIGLTNTGGATINVAPGEDDGGGQDIPWLDVSTVLIALDAGESTSLDVDLDAAGLGDNVYRGIVTLQSDDPGASVHNVAVELTVVHPEFAAGVDSVSFAAAALNQQRQTIINTWNAGTDTLLIDPPTGVSGPFTATLLDSGTAAPGDSARIQVTGAWGFRGVFRDTVFIGSNDPDLPTASIPLILSVGGPSLTMPDTTHIFGSAAVGDTIVWVMDLANVGEDTLSVSGLASDDVAFVVNLASTLEIAPAETLGVTVAFAPTGAGPHSGSLQLVHDDPAGRTSVAVSGTGLAGDAAFIGSSLDLGAVALGDTALATARLINLGDAEFSVAAADVDSPFSLVTAGEPWSVAVGETLSLDLRYTPTAGGTAFGTLTADTDEVEGSTPSLALGGTGLLPDFSWSVQEIDYGIVAVGVNRDTTVVLRNPGEGAVEVDAAFAAGTSYQIISPVFPADIPANDSLLVQLRFVPGGLGTMPDTLQFTTPWEFLAPAEIVLDGSGATASLAVDYNSHDFGSVLVGEEHDWGMIVSNGGNLAAEVFVPPLTSPFAPADTAWATVPAVGQVEVHILFQPTMIGTWADTVEIYSGSPQTLLGTVPLVAASVQPVLDPLPTEVVIDVWEDTVLETGIPLTNSGDGMLSCFLQAVSLPPPAWLEIPEPISQVMPDATMSAPVTLTSAGLPFGIQSRSMLLITNDAAAESTTFNLKMRVPRMRYATHDAGDMHLTVADEGAIGFLDAQQNELYGVGLQWPPASPSHLVHGALWVGDGPDRLSDASFDYDFAVVPGQELSFADGDTQTTTCVFTDSLATNPLGVRVAQTTYAYAADGSNDYVILDFALTATTVLTDVYVGMYLEPDIGNFLNNAGGYLADVRTGEMYATDGSQSTRVGVVALDNDAPSAFTMIHNPTYIWPTADIPDTSAWGFMTSGVFDTGVHSPDDYSMVLTMGPLTLYPESPVHVPFAVAAGSSQAELKTAAAAALASYHGIVSGVDDLAELPERFTLDRPYPNPFNPILHVPVLAPEGGGKATVEIFDVRGRRVRTIWESVLPPGRSTLSWYGRDDSGRTQASGVYFVRLRAGGVTDLRKVVLIR